MCLELKQPFQHVCSPWRARRRECIDLNSKAQTAERAWEITVGRKKPRIIPAAWGYGCLWR
ncbi:hypothetical protein PG5_38790 [Pseudomonas sp. G5(2012)]|nr:hypothetical protein PG5_38790 [Pseudomonas sp. G5(2012)]